MIFLSVPASPLRDMGVAKKAKRKAVPREKSFTLWSGARGSVRTSDYSHIVIRKEHVLCTICLEMEPVHPGDGTPLPAFEFALEWVKRRHPPTPHGQMEY